MIGLNVAVFAALNYPCRGFGSLPLISYKNTPTDIDTKLILV